MDHEDGWLFGMMVDRFAAEMLAPLATVASSPGSSTTDTGSKLVNNSRSYCWIYYNGTRVGKICSTTLGWAEGWAREGWTWGGGKASRWLNQVRASVLSTQSCSGFYYDDLLNKLKGELTKIFLRPTNWPWMCRDLLMCKWRGEPFVLLK